MKKIQFKKGDKVIYEVAGTLDWEDIDEARQDGLEVGKEYTVQYVDEEYDAVIIKESLVGLWISAKHFKLKQ